ncbi:type II secretion system F family protein [Anaerosinus massiliensis]|uniref:type II secretion system F family protein n=1 Tax=Massilibacillus massiliensis TaxID=1806837 RepID=UPI000AABCCBB|nr:type II secretion system F family protein [Massilibacillus massiliensis]
MALWIALACGFFIFLFFYLFIITKIAPRTQVKERVQRMQRAASLDEQVRFESDKLDKPFTERIVLPFFHGIEEKLIRLAPSRISEMLAARILRAGKQHIWSVNAFVCFWMLSSIACMIIAVFFAFYVKHMIFIQGFAITVAAIVIGAALPLVFLDSLIAKRRKLILRQLPEVLDLLCVSVQAGLSFDGAMSKVTDKMKGPLIDECSKMLRDIRMGMTRRIALTNMAERCRLQEMHLFTAAVIQSDRLGVSMGKTLLVQSENMRERRRQSIKEEALKAPVKMLFPLVLFIFPALFIVVLVPVILSLARNLGGVLGK